MYIGSDHFATRDLSLGVIRTYCWSHPLFGRGGRDQKTTNVYGPISQSLVVFRHATRKSTRAKTGPFMTKAELDILIEKQAKRLAERDETTLPTDLTHSHVWKPVPGGKPGIVSCVCGAVAQARPSNARTDPST